MTHPTAAASAGWTRTGHLRGRAEWGVSTELLFLTDAYLTRFDGTVTAVDHDTRRVALDRTAFYPTGGGQPHDTGVLAGLAVTEVRKEGDEVWHTLAGGGHTLAVGGHTLAGGGPLPVEGDMIDGEIDWGRRHALMRTHTALHILCGVIWNEWGKAVTGGNMEPLSARMDFEFDPLPDGFSAVVEQRVNAEIVARRPVEVSSCLAAPRSATRT